MCMCVCVCVGMRMFCHIKMLSVFSFFVILQSLPAAAFSDWNFGLITLLHDCVNSPNVRQLLSQFLHTCYICSCFQLVMVASSLENALVLEFPVSTLYEAYVSIVLVQKIACVQTCRPHNSMSPVFLVVQSRVCFLASTKTTIHDVIGVRIVVFGVSQFLCCVNLPGVTWSNYFTSADLFNNFFAFPWHGVQHLEIKKAVDTPLCEELLCKKVFSRHHTHPQYANHNFQYFSEIFNLVSPTPSPIPPSPPSSVGRTQWFSRLRIGAADPQQAIRPGIHRMHRIWFCSSTVSQPRFFEFHAVFVQVQRIADCISFLFEVKNKRNIKAVHKSIKLSRIDH